MYIKVSGHCPVVLNTQIKSPELASVLQFTVYALVAAMNLPLQVTFDLNVRLLLFRRLLFLVW